MGLEWVGLHVGSVFCSFLFTYFFKIGYMFTRRPSPVVNFSLSRLARAESNVGGKRDSLVGSCGSLVGRTSTYLALGPRAIASNVLPPSKSGRSFCTVKGCT